MVLIMPDIRSYADFKALFGIQHHHNFGQREIIDRFKHNKDLINTGGMCFGITHLAIHAFLAGDLETFSNRLLALNQIPRAQFPMVYEQIWALNTSLHQLVKEKQDILRAEDEGTPEYQAAMLDLLQCKDEFDEVNTFIVGMDAFLAGISLFQKPHSYTSSKEQPIFSETTLQQREAPPLVREIVNPIAFDNPDEQPIEVASTVGSYDEGELVSYLDVLQSNLSSLRFSMELSNGEHSVALCHDANGWILIDPNNLPGESFSKVEHTEIAKAVRKALQVEKEKYSTFMAEAYVNKKNEVLFKQSIERIYNDPAWIKAHELTAEKAEMNFFLKLACRKELFAPVIEKILEYPDSIPRGYFLPLTKAIQEGSIGLTGALLNAKKTDVLDTTPLHLACESGNLEIIKLILDDEKSSISTIRRYNFDDDVFLTPKGQQVQDMVRQRVEDKKASKAQKSPNKATPDTQAEMTNDTINPRKKAAIAAVAKNGIYLEKLTEFQNDADVALTAAMENISAMQFISQNLLSSEAFMLALVERKPVAIIHATEHNDSPKIMLAAVKNNARYLQYASEQLQHNIPFLLQAIEQNALVARYIPQEIGTEAFYLEATKLNAKVLPYIPRSYIIEGFLLQVIKNNPEALKHAPQAFQNDPNFLLKAITENKEAFRYIPSTLDNYSELLEKLKYISIIDNSFDKISELIPNALKSNRMFIMEAARQIPNAVDFATEALRQDEDFMAAMHHVAAQKTLINKENIIDFILDSCKPSNESLLSTLSFYLRQCTLMAYEFGAGIIHPPSNLVPPANYYLENIDTHKLAKILDNVAGALSAEQRSDLKSALEERLPEGFTLGSLSDKFLNMQQEIQDLKDDAHSDPPSTSPENK